MEWGEVPTNGYGSLDGIHTPFLDMGLAVDLRPKVITSMRPSPISSPYCFKTCTSRSLRDE